MTSPKHVRDSIRMLRDLGYRTSEPYRSNGHYRLVAQTPDGRQRTFVISGTPSDWRGSLNFLAEARRFLIRPEVSQTVAHVEPRHGEARG